MSWISIQDIFYFYFTVYAIKALFNIARKDSWSHVNIINRELLINSLMLNSHWRVLALINTAFKTNWFDIFKRMPYPSRLADLSILLVYYRKMLKCYHTTEIFDQCATVKRVFTSKIHYFTRTIYICNDWFTCSNTWNVPEAFQFYQS